MFTNNSHLGSCVNQFAEDNFVRRFAVGYRRQPVRRRLVYFPAQRIKALREQQGGVQRGFLPPQVLLVHRAIFAERLEIRLVFL